VVIKVLLKYYQERIIFLRTKFKIYNKTQVTILSISDNKIRITVDDKRIPTCNQGGNLFGNSR